MYPQDPYQPQPSQQPQLSPNPIPVDYLDQISGPQQKPSMSNKLFFGVIIGGIILAILALLLLISGSGGGKSISTERLGLRLQNLQTISKDSQKTIKDSELRALNSRLTTQLTDINRDVATPLKAADINLKKADKKTMDQEKKRAETLTAKLEDSRLNATFDRSYAREVSYEMETTAILMNSLRKSSNSKSLRTFLDSASVNFIALQKEFARYSASSR